MRVPQRSQTGIMPIFRAITPHLLEFSSRTFNWQVGAVTALYRDRMACRMDRTYVARQRTQPNGFNERVFFKILSISILEEERISFKDGCNILGRHTVSIEWIRSTGSRQTQMKTQKLMNHVRLPHFLEYQSKEFPRRRRENRGFSSFLSICCFMVSQWSFYRRKDGSLCTRSVPVWRRRKDGVRTRFLCFPGSIDCHLQCIRRQAEIDPYKWRAASWALADLLRDLNEISLSISSKGTRFALFVYAMLHRRVSQCIYLVLYLCCRKNNMDSFFSIGFICVFVVCVSKSEQWNTISNWHHDSPLNHKLRPYALLLIQKRFWF